MIPFYSDCVSWPTPLLPVLEFLVDEGVEITRETFRRRVRPPVATGWDDPGLRPASDWATHYFGLRGHPIYWLTNSCIEYVFAEPETILALEGAACLSRRS